MDRIKKAVLNIVTWVAIGFLVSFALYFIGNFVGIEIPFWVFIIVICVVSGVANWKIDSL